MTKEDVWVTIPSLPDYEMTKEGWVRNKITRLHIPHHLTIGEDRVYIRLYVAIEHLRRNECSHFYIDNLIKETFPDEN